jgi:hypothetical protein
MRITAGLALNRRGDTLELPADQIVALVKDTTAKAAAAGAFAECAPPLGVTTLTNLGLYVLTVLPASGLDGRAPMTDLVSDGVASTCGSRYDVEGVKFRLLNLNLGTATDAASLRARVIALATQLDSQITQFASSTPSQQVPLAAPLAKNLSKLRNGVAHLCFGTEDAVAFVRNPLGDPGAGAPHADYGALDQLRDDGVLTDCEVPLALIYWTVTGVQFVDMWAVRRALTIPAPSSHWSFASGNRRIGEGWASVLQFQAQLIDLMNPGAAIGAANLQATEMFLFLPPIGFLPIGIAPAIDLVQFFTSKTTRGPLFLEGSKLLETMWGAIEFPPIDLSNKEVCWLYRVRENVQAVERQLSGTRLFVLFTNGFVLNRGRARFDLAYWDYASYA